MLFVAVLFLLRTSQVSIDIVENDQGGFEVQSSEVVVTSTQKGSSSLQFHSSSKNIPTFDNASSSELNIKIPSVDSSVPPLKPVATLKNILPTQTSSATTSPTTITPVKEPPSEQSINPQSILGIVCDYDYFFLNPLTGARVDGKTEQKGSGVIIDPRGYVITNRHVLEREEQEANLEINGNSYSVTLHFSLRSCRAGRVARGLVLPTKQEILTYNPSAQVPVLGYKLQKIYVRDRLGMSEGESFMADFALLKIVGLTDEAPTFGISSLPASFEYARLLPLKDLDIPNKEVFTYGFPGDVTEGKQSDFETLYFTGSVGRIVQIEEGDQYYKGTPLSIVTKMEIYHGRSGSPLFWRGYVIGLVTALDSRDRTNSYSVASDVILRDIKSYLN